MKFAVILPSSVDPKIGMDSESLKAIVLLIPI